MKKTVEELVNDPVYLKNIEYGKPRSGHPEGAVKHHIYELEGNLLLLKDRVSEEEYWKLLFLIHIHDTFKADSLSGVSITDPNSHASLARAFASKYTTDQDLLNMIQYHDEGYALWRQFHSKGSYNVARMKELIDTIKDWRLFLIFSVIDASTDGKDRTVITWFLREVKKYIDTEIDESWIL